jgi:hypothetical protein
MLSLKRIPQLLRETWEALRKAFDPRSASRARAVADREGLRTFLEARASYVAQMSLYGYLRTRAGVRFPELFDDDPFVVSINIAKWHIWLACLSDLSVYAGFLMLRRTRTSADDIGKLMRGVLEDALAVAGTPADAGPEFATHANRVRARLALCDWPSIEDNEFAFVESPDALVQWAPIVDDLKQLDAEVVRNSVRFRWQEVRRDLRRDLRADAVLAEASAGGATAIAVP